MVKIKKRIATKFEQNVVVPDVAGFKTASRPLKLQLDGKEITVHPETKEDSGPTLASIAKSAKPSSLVERLTKTHLEEIAEEVHLQSKQLQFPSSYDGEKAAYLEENAKVANPVKYPSHEGTTVSYVGGLDSLLEKLAEIAPNCVLQHTTSGWYVQVGKWIDSASEASPKKFEWEPVTRIYYTPYAAVEEALREPRAHQAVNPPAPYEQPLTQGERTNVSSVLYKETLDKLIELGYPKQYIEKRLNNITYASNRNMDQSKFQENDLVVVRANTPHKKIFDKINPLEAYPVHEVGLYLTGVPKGWLYTLPRDNPDAVHEDDLISAPLHNLNDNVKVAGYDISGKIQAIRYSDMPMDNALLGTWQYNIVGNPYWHNEAIVEIDHYYSEVDLDAIVDKMKETGVSIDPEVIQQVKEELTIANPEPTEQNEKLKAIEGQNVIAERKYPSSGDKVIEGKYTGIDYKSFNNPEHVVQIMRGSRRRPVAVDPSSIIPIGDLEEQSKAQQAAENNLKAAGVPI